MRVMNFRKPFDGVEKLFVMRSIGEILRDGLGAMDYCFIRWVAKT